MSDILERVKVPEIVNDYYNGDAARKIYDHAAGRAKMRYGIDFTPDMRLLFIRAILAVPRPGEQHCAVCLRRPRLQEPFRAVWGLKYDGRLIPVVFDGAAMQIVTFLPQSWLTAHNINVNAILGVQNDDEKGEAQGETASA